MGRKNIKIPEDLFLALRDDKDDQQSWPHYLEESCLLDEPGTRDAAVADRVDGVEIAVKELTQQVQSLERTLEAMQ